MKHVSLYLFIYLILSIASFLLLSYEKNTKIDTFIQAKTKLHMNTYDVFYSKYEAISNLTYSTIINTKDVKDIFKKASSESLRDTARKELKSHIESAYIELKKFNIKQLHFHLSNNESFLRFHRPNKFGDDLSNIRQTVSYVNKYKKPIKGFEEGKIYNGYRFVYPLFDEDIYLGSVEVSYSTAHLNKDYISTYKVDSIFLIRKEIVDKKLFEDEKSNYQVSEIDDFYVEKKLLDIANSFSISTEKTAKYIQTHIKSPTTFSLYNDETHKLMTFVKVKNPITQEVVAVWIIGVKAPFIFNQTLNFYILFLLINFLLIGVLSFIYRRTCYREMLEKRIKKEVELSRKKDVLLIEQAKVSENKLNKSLALFGANVIASHSDLKGIITYASDAACKISGFTKEELIGAPHSILRHPDMPSEIFEDLWKTIKSGKEWRGEIKNMTKDGGYYWTRATIVPDIDEDNNIQGYRSIRQDITHEKAKEEFMANMSHELRTPLNAIIGFSGILTKKLKEKEFLLLSSQINQSSKSLLNLINDILDLSKIQDSSFTIEPFEFNGYEEVVEFSEQFEGLVAKKILHFKTIIADNLKATFYADWVRINQICFNLISNAVKFTPSGGEITFDVKYQDDCFIISVKDNGIGMNQEVQDKIFKPFEQADGTTTRKYGGTGLGLSITQKLVELMNGKIELESQEDVGTTFRVSLPIQIRQRDENEEVSTAIGVEDKDDTLKGHILIVEDNKTNQMLVKMLIEDFGLTCDIANDGVEATEIYDPSKHALILMDENMPNMNGLEAMKIIQEKYKDGCTPIVALTANTMQGDREKFLKLGMDGYVSKPINEDEFYSALVEFL